MNQLIINKEKVLEKFRIITEKRDLIWFDLQEKSDKKYKL